MNIGGIMQKALKGLEKNPSPHSAGGSQGRRILKKGMSGMDVARCQNLLNRELAYSPPPLWVDGIFGAKTDRKVREFQMKKRLTVDGVVGSATWSALEGAPVGMGGGGGGLGADKNYGGGGGYKNPIDTIGQTIGKSIGQGFGGVLDKAGKYLK